MINAALLGVLPTEMRRSDGGFYDGAHDHPEGAVAWATIHAQQTFPHCMRAKGAEQ